MCQRPQHGEALLGREQRLRRLVGELGRVARAGGVRQVGGIRHHQVEALARHRLVEAAFQEAHATGELEPLGVARAPPRARRARGRSPSPSPWGARSRAPAPPLPSRCRRRESASSASGSGTELERSLDQRLRLRARREHVRRHRERERPELPAADQLRHRHALLGPAAHQLAKARALGGRERLVELDVEPEPIDARARARAGTRRRAARSRSPASRSAPSSSAGARGWSSSFEPPAASCPAPGGLGARRHLDVDRVEQVLEIAGQDRLELVQRDARAVVGDARLREVVGADLLAAVAAPDLRAPRAGALARLARPARPPAAARAGS